MFTPPRVLIFGEVLWDQFPEGPVLGGSPVNIAAHLHRSGIPVALVSRVGNDESGREAFRQIEALGLDTRWIQTDPDLPTPIAHVECMDGTPKFVFAPDQSFDAIRVPEDGAMLESVQIVHFGTLARRSPISRESVRGILAATAGHRFVDLNLREPWYSAELVEETFRHSNSVKLSESELAEVARLLSLPHADTPEGQAVELLHRHHLDLLVVTCGESGSFALEARDRIHRQLSPGPIDALADTVGAGDAFTAVMILARLHCWSTSHALQRADALARETCRHRGAILPDPKTYRELELA